MRYKTCCQIQSIKLDEGKKYNKKGKHIFKKISKVKLQN